MRLGILGGTFDPIHNGHIAAARASAQALSLDRILLIPAGNPQHRVSAPVATAEQRYEMVVAACAEQSAADVSLQPSRIDIDRAGPTYSIDTVAAVRREYGDAELFLILGADAFAQLDTWREPEQLRKQATCVVVQRTTPSDAPASVVDAGAVSVALEGCDVSATDIRARVAAGQPIDRLVPSAVAAYIGAHGLYR